MKYVFQKIEKPTGYDVKPRRVAGPPDPRIIHFLHIGKNAGTQMTRIAKQVNSASDRRRIKKHSHDVFLFDLPKGEDYVFSIRDPISRFRSGFYSRKRKGAPRYYNEWTRSDALAFSHFDHANDLAEALFAPGERGVQAWCAMKTFRHTAQNQSDWFYKNGYFLKHRPPIWIIRQEAFDTDIREFLRRADLGIDLDAIDLTSDPVQSHMNDYADVPPLSEQARQNLERWYIQDRLFHDLCTQWLKGQGNLSW